jgi:heme oxygenase
VDEAFGAFDLGCPRAYGLALSAHARCAPAVEAGLKGARVWSAWAERTPLLAADMAELGRAAPPPLELGAPLCAAGAWGAQYVMEGSKLGGKLLARRVAPGLPRRYLAAEGEPGWPRFQAELQAAADHAGPGFIEAAVRAARRVFLMFERAAVLEWDAAHGR